MPINKESFYGNNGNWDFFDEEFLNTPEYNFASQGKWAENEEKQWHSQSPKQDQDQGQGQGQGQGQAQGQGQGQGQGQLQGQAVGQAQGQALGQDFSGVVQHQYITVNYGGSRPHRRQPMRNYQDERGNQFMNFYDPMYEEDNEEDLYAEYQAVYGKSALQGAQAPALRRANYPTGNYYDYGYNYGYDYDYGYGYSNNNGSNSGFRDDWWLIILLLFFCGGCGLGFGGFFF